MELVELVASPTNAPDLLRQPTVELILINGRRLALFGEIAPDRLAQIAAALERG